VIIAALLLPLSALKAPEIDYAGLSPIIALGGGACLTLLVGLLPGTRPRMVVTVTALLTLAVATGLSIWQFGEDKSIVSGALRVDDLALSLDFVFYAAAAIAIVLSLREPFIGEMGEGEYFTLLLSSVAGMVVLAGAENLITLFLGFEVLSIPLYVLSAGDLLRRTSLESGLKYLVVGSVGSATLVYGLAFVYGASGSTDFTQIAASIGGDVLGDPLLLVGIALSLTGLAFKASVAPFHQWTPDVYQGAPTPVTAFMAVATKAAAFAVLLRFFDTALLPAHDDWNDAIAALAVISIAIGNIGAIGQNSLKRMLAWSGVAQAGYMLAGVTVASALGVKSVVFYLFVYLLMNVAAFAVVIARERETPYGDDVSAIAALGSERQVLAWSLTISMLALAGLPGTAGFVGKFYLIEAAVKGDFTWLGVAIVIGTMLSLVYYLRIVALVWMRPEAEEHPAMPRTAPAIAGGAPDAEELRPHAAAARASRQGVPGPHATPPVEVVAVAALAAGAAVVFGIVPGPLLDLATNAGQALVGLS
jgi:NADH-quinone oxidoreductase subunit N